jgi:MFS family permease
VPEFQDSPLSSQSFQPDSRAAWIRLAIALVIGSIGSVGMWSVVVAIPAVQIDFGATRAAASLAFTCTMLGFGLGGVAMGRLSDRLGIVSAIGIGVVALAAGYIGAGSARQMWQFNLMHMAIGLGGAATFGPLMAEASHWFERYRGLGVTIAASGNYVAGAIWPPIIAHGIADIGWRQTHILIGIGCSAAMGLMALVLRWQTGREAVRSHINAPPPRIDLQMNTNALTVFHIVAYCGDLGYGAARGAEMLSLMLGLGIVSRIGSGFLADRIGGLRTLLIGSVAQGVALLFYLLFNSLSSLYLISAMFGLFQGGIVPSYAIIVREAMPAREAATRVGIVIFASVLGMSFGGYISGVIFDATGSYAAAFLNGLAWNAVNITIVVSLLLRARRVSPSRDSADLVRA